jgi:L,D-transpeptidase YcbB
MQMARIRHAVGIALCVALSGASAPHSLLAQPWATGGHSRVDDTPSATSGAPGDAGRALLVTAESVAVIVNIPEFRLYAFRTDSLGRRETLSMAVVVGSANVARTPVFSDSIRYLEFAPTWNVPRSIIAAELLPFARRDPYLLRTNHYEMVDRRGRAMPYTAASVERVARGDAWVRQLPGGTNALGRVKFMFPNEHDVYMHDTPVQRDFLATRRDGSHGCIRVADPEALARFLLQDQAHWTPDAMRAAMHARAPTRVMLSQPVPVHLVYATAVMRDDGRVDVFDDIYQLDAPRSARVDSVSPH